MLDLLIGELKRTWIQTLRYPSEVFGGVIILTAVFYGIFVGAQYMSGSSTFGDRLDSVVVGYVIWTLVVYIVNDIATNLQIEANTGTSRAGVLIAIWSSSGFSGAGDRQSYPTLLSHLGRHGHHHRHDWQQNRLSAYFATATVYSAA